MDETREVVLTGEEATRYLAEQQMKAPVTLTAKDLIHDAAKPTKAELQQSLVVDRISKEYDMIRMRRLDTYYIREKQSPSFTFRRAYQQDLENLARDTYIGLRLIPTAKKVKDTVETIKTMVKEEMDNLTNTIEVVPGLYWDNTQSDALTQRPETPCLRRLFDNGSYSSPAIITIDPTDSLVGDAAKYYVKSVYSNTLKWLNNLDGTLPSLTDYEDAGGVGNRSLPVLFSFPFIYTWACDNHELYMDMLKAACTIFMKNKPKKVFALTGLKRNGKSTYLSMLHTLLGRANTSALKLSELSDAHQTDQLRFTMMNAPDEEASISDMSSKDIANFKSLASHDPIFANKMYSPDASFISSDFPCFMAWNQDPKWKGSGAAACAERTIIIPFNADLSKFDTGGKDFKKETFTADMFMDLVGVLLALAHYYDDHEMTFSEATMAETNEVNEDVNAPIEYAKLFLKWYAGFDKQSTVFDDFTAWCTQNGYGYQGVTTKDVIFALKKIGGTPTRTNFSNKPAQKLPLAIGKSYLASEQYIPELKNTVGSILWYGEGHSTGNSVTQGLEDWLTMQQIPKVERAHPDYQMDITEWKEKNGE